MQASAVDPAVQVEEDAHVFERAAESPTFVYGNSSGVAAMKCGSMLQVFVQKGIQRGGAFRSKGEQKPIFFPSESFCHFETNFVGEKKI